MWLGVGGVLLTIHPIIIRQQYAHTKPPYTQDLPTHAPTISPAPPIHHSPPHRCGLQVVGFAADGISHPRHALISRFNNNVHLVPRTRRLWW